MDTVKEQLKKLPKEKLTECIDKNLNNLGISLGELNEYNEKKFSQNKEDYKAVYPKSPTITHSDGKTYITNLKVLLAQNLYTGNKMIKLTDKLSKQLKIPEPPISWYISEKFDGIRAIWDGEKFVSRGQKVFTYVPEFFVRLMPPGIALDGEIWIGRNKFKEASRLSTLKIGSSRNQKQIDDLWRGKDEESCVKYMVYDLPASIEPFEIRMNFLEQIIKDRTYVWNEIEENVSKCPIRLTQQTKIKSMEQLINTYKTLTSVGAEGVMLRAPNSPYEPKRSKYLLKYKIKEDSEAIVRGYTKGTGKYSGLLGSLDCELIIDNEPSGVMFNIGTGFTDKDRTEYNNPKSSLYIPIGSIVSFSYMELSEDSVPRHPVYRGIRDDFKLKERIDKSNQSNESNQSNQSNQSNESNESNETIANDEEPKDYKQTIIDTFKILIKNEETQKELNWQFKRKSYKQVVDILSASPSTAGVYSVKDALQILRDGGSKLQGEEAYFIKNGEYKSRSIQKINEIIKTGKLSRATEIQDDPKVQAITELTKIPEIGPSKAEALYEKGITTIAELNNAYLTNSNIINAKQAIGLKHYEDLEKRISREEMDKWNLFFKNIFNETVNQLEKKNKNKNENENESYSKIQLVGSYRRGAETSGDIDILITSQDTTFGKKLMTKFIKNLLLTDKMDESLIFSSGTTKFMGLGKIETTSFYRHIDIFYYSQKEYPFALLFSTGSGQFNIEMRADAIKKGYSLSEKELKYTNGTPVTEEDYESDIKKSYPTEEKDIFDFLGIKYVEPKDRQSGTIINK
jgi:ATP-dependent DNA ligase/DNA polymerase/3'-5' exonuclease PolX